MEFASKLRWALVVITVVLFLILVGWGLYSIARSIFDSNAGDSENVQEVSAVVDEDIRSTSTARYYLDGKTVANSEHRSYSIEVSRNVVTMKVYKSYGEDVIREKSYQNTPEAYESFLASLDHLGIKNRRPNTNTDDDFKDLGACPSGFRYVVELDSTLRRWTTSCSGKGNFGTAGFSMNAVKSLFQKQVIDFDALTDDIDF